MATTSKKTVEAAPAQGKAVKKYTVEKLQANSVSYTHLTLPTICSV